MATTYKNAQVQGTSGITTYATLYNTGASSTAVISSILICNTASVSATYRIGIMGTAGTPGASQWVVYDAPVAARDTICLTLGITLGNSQFIRISSSANTVAFSAYVSEIT
jgi:hypothetical protein